jgi:hypothetical protein
VLCQRQVVVVVLLVAVLGMAVGVD